MGAVLGLWPFQQGIAPALGAVIKGREMTAALIARLDPKDYPLEFFSPSGGQIAGAHYGLGGIPPEWVERLAMLERIKAFGEALARFEDARRLGS